MTLVFMFPGQSSRYPTMIHKLARLDRAALEVLIRASDKLGRDLGKHYRPDNEAQFACNRDVQIGVFVANHMLLALCERRGVVADASLGLSLGEYNHLVHIGALDFEQALEVVEARGEAYDAGPRGGMASVFPIELEELAEVVERARDGQVLEIVNLNSPRQHVLSGEREALDRALGLLDEEHFVEATVIEKDVPMHSSLFRSVGERLRRRLCETRFAEARLPYLPNRLGRFEPDPDYVELLSSHVHMPVLWRRSIDFLMERYRDPFLLEVGPRAVLANLLDKKWHRGVHKAALDSKDDTAEHIEEVLATISGLPVEEVARAVG